MMKSKPAIKRIVRALAQLDRRMRSAASFVLCAAVVIAGGMTLSAQTFTSLQSFDRANGENPAAALTQGTNGNLYGTTAGGGAGFQGTVFEITTSGTLTSLYSFCSQLNCTDGLWPYAGLVLATNGNFYGTTEYGGSGYVGFSNCSLPCGYGTVFEITPAGALTTLHSFCSQASECTDGQFPVAGLTLAGNGDLYGDTSSAPTIFSITTSGTLTTLYSFNIFSYGPRAALVQATNGDLYGTTFSDSVFKITLTGTLTNLYTFPDTADPFDGL